MKNCLSESSLKVTRPNGERSKILVSNPVLLMPSVPCAHNRMMRSITQDVFNGNKLCRP